MEWEKQTALITGGGSGIGKEITRIMYQRGAHVIVATLMQEELDELQKTLTDGPGKLTGIAIDLTADNAIGELTSKLDDMAIEPTILVNNAGSGLLGNHVDLDSQKIRNVLELNIQALTELCSVFARRWIANKQGGSMLNVASIGGFVPVPQLAAYSASKHYVLAFTHALSHELAPHRIHVGALCPGITRTKIYDTMGLSAENQSKGSISDVIDSFAMDAEQVAACAIQAIETRQVLALPGINKLVPLARLLPPRVTSWFMHKVSEGRSVS